MHPAVLLGLALVPALGCSAERRASAASLRGPLAAIVETPPVAVGPCEVAAREYARPFWRAPYRQCRDSLADGSQLVEADADGVVTEVSREWKVPVGGEQAAWDREAQRLTVEFGRPVWDSLAPTQEDSADLKAVHRRGYCAAWRGPDSVQVALRLTSVSDVSPAPGTPWRLIRKARNGPLPDAVACGRASSPP